MRITEKQKNYYLWFITKAYNVKELKIACEIKGPEKEFVYLFCFR